MTNYMKVFLSGVLVAILSVGFSQQAGPGRTGASGQGGRQPGFFAPGSGFRAFLIMREDVQKELKLTEAQKKSLQARLQALFPRSSGQTSPRSQGGQGGQGGGASRPNPSEAVDKAIKEILTPAQQKRLQELALQWDGPSALLRTDIAQKVGLSSQQQQKIRELVQAQSQKMREAFQRARNNPGEREKLRQQMEQNRKDLNNKILALLTPAQKQKWQSLLGKPFTFNPPRGSREIRRAVPARP